MSRIAHAHPSVRTTTHDEPSVAYRPLSALRRGQTGVIVDLANTGQQNPGTQKRGPREAAAHDRTSALALGGHRLAVGDRVTVRRAGDPMLLLFDDRAGRPIRIGLCARTAAGILVAPAATSIPPARR